MNTIDMEKHIITCSLIWLYSAIILFLGGWVLPPRNLRYYLMFYMPPMVSPGSIFHSIFSRPKMKSSINGQPLSGLTINFYSASHQILI